MDGHMESLGEEYQHINQRVLHHAPCSVAILVDRGLGGAAQVPASDVSYNIAVLFFGGRDDREALAYGMRMVEHPGIELHVLRFLPQSSASGGDDDEAFLADFRGNVVTRNESARYEEKTYSASFHIAMDVLVLSNGWHCSKIRVYNFTSTTLPLYASCPYRNEGVHGHLLSPAPPDSLASSLQPAPFTSISAPLQPSPSSSPIQFDSVLF
jgi:hypothetical protein